MNPPQVVIAGAGLGGLSVASALAASPGGPEVVLVDPREAWDNDRTWCFWARAGDPALDWASHTWTSWRVRDEGRDVVRSAPGEVYAHVPAGRVYADLLGRLRASPRVHFRRGAVRLVEDLGERARVWVGEESIDADHVVDTRPPDFTAPAPAGHRRLLQHFVGWHVRTARPMFEPGVVELMDFDSPGREAGVNFRYVLPFAPDEALVEDTWFGEAPLPAEVYRAAMAGWLEPRAGGWELLREERGVLPMTTEPFPPHPSPRVWRVGLAGGAARPSTGYAFLSTRRLAEDVAQRILVGDNTAPRVRPARVEWLDAVFLEWLHRHPLRAAGGFFRMFERADPGAIVRFLSDRSSMFDDLRVVASLAPYAGGEITPIVAERFGAPRRVALLPSR